MLLSYALRMDKKEVLTKMQSMKKTFLILFLATLMPLVASAQASGGQIRRKPSIPSQNKRQTKTHIIYKEDSSNVATLENGKKFKYETTQIVDLGLPSGTLWAGWNIGANVPTEIGEYYAWGDVYSNTTYDWQYYFDTYRQEKGIVYFNKYRRNSITSIISSDRDVASVKWGSPWKMPSISQVEELIKNCDIYLVRCKESSSDCVLFKGPNGKCLIFPRSGIKHGTSIDINGVLCWVGELDLHYNLSNMGCVLKFHPYQNILDSELRCNGINVRAVRSR